MANAYTLDFEKPLLELERQIEELKRVGEEREIDVAEELGLLQGKLDALREDIYRNLTPMQRVSVARHPRRPDPPPVSSNSLLGGRRRRLGSFANRYSAHR